MDSDLFLGLKKAVVITGHYGSGKTNLAVNLAVDYAKAGEKVCIVDLDIVNPYFRTADFKDLFDKTGIHMAAPLYANTNLDIPSLGFDMSAFLQNFDRTVIDSGGDDAGAAALGQYSALFNNTGYDMLYVVNKYRYLTSEPEDALELLRDIEGASYLKATALVNNSNLGCETDENIVSASENYALKAAEKAGIPMLFTAAKREICKINWYPVDIYVRPFWEE